MVGQLRNGWRTRRIWKKNSLTGRLGAMRRTGYGGGQDEGRLLEGSERDPGGHETEIRDLHAKSGEVTVELDFLGRGYSMLN